MPIIKTIPTVTVTGEAEIPYGHSNSISIYVDEVEYETSDYRLEIRENSIPYFEATLDDIEASDRAHVMENKVVKIFAENTLIFKGKLRRPEYKTENLVKIVARGYLILLKDDTVTRDVTDESKFDSKDTDYIVEHILSKNNDGSSPWLIQPGNVDNLGTFTTRGDFDNKFAMIRHLATECNAKFRARHTGTDFGNDYFDFQTQVGSAVSKYTFRVSGDEQNSEETRHEKDYDSLVNSVTLLGYGDGINQLQSKIIHATLKRSTLSSDISISAATISLVDASSFGSSGSIWIGIEKVTYTGKSGNNLTGCTRGTSGTTAYAHKNKIAVYDAVYTETSPEVDSSIEANGLKKDSFTDRSIIDQNTLDFAVQYYLEEHYELVRRITVEPMDEIEILTSMVVDDTVTLIDTEANLDSLELRVHGLILSCEEDFTRLEVEVGNRGANIISNIQSINNEVNIAGRYMQGSTNIYAINSAENCDTSNPLHMRFYVPSETIAINTVKLNFKIKNYRAYHSAISTAESNTPIALNQKKLYMEANSGTLGNPYLYVNMPIMPSFTASQFDRAGYYFSIFNKHGGTAAYAWSLDVQEDLEASFDNIWTGGGQLIRNDATLKIELANAFIARGTNCAKVKLYCSKDAVDTPTTNLRVAIRADNNGIPTETDLSYADVAPASISTSYGWVEFDFTDETLTAGNKYWIVIYMPTVETGKKYWVTKNNNISYAERPASKWTGSGYSGTWGTYGSQPSLPNTAETFTMKVYASVGTVNLDSGSISLADGEAMIGEYYDTVNRNGSQIKFSSTTSLTGNDSMDLDCKIFTKHTHSVSTTTTYGIHKISPSSPSITVKVGEDGGSLSEVNGSPFTSDQENLDITSSVRAVGTGKWIDIEFTPDQNIRIEATVYVQIFIESK